MPGSAQVFRARRSVGSISMGVLSLFMLALAGLALMLTIRASAGGVVAATVTMLVGALVFVVLGVLALLFALWLPGMRYELGERELVIRLGPMTRRIVLSSIKEISRRDLTLVANSLALPLPGAVVGKMTYPGLGMVTMFSTAMLKGVMVIVTDRGSYGITPEREEELVAEINRLTAGKSN